MFLTKASLVFLLLLIYRRSVELVVMQKTSVDIARYI